MNNRPASSSRYNAWPSRSCRKGSDWEYEIKFDGYRALGIKSAGRVRLVSRNENDFSARFPCVARAISKLPDDTVVDGEIVALDETGKPSFNVLQNYNHSATPLQFYAFDLLHLAGKNLRDRPLDDRRELLRAKVMPRMQGEIRFSETVEATAVEIVAAVKKQGLEGVIASAAMVCTSRPALGSLGKNAYQQETGACDRRLCPDR
jgi:bifunctional non-homologous end joining protein LigD